jgi:hypothetical protein
VLQLRLGYRSAAILFAAIGLALLAATAAGSSAIRRRRTATAVITVLAGLVGVVLYWRVLDLVASGSLG